MTSGRQSRQSPAWTCIRCAPPVRSSGLQRTVAGCDWLLDRWTGLSRRLRDENVWLPSDAFKMVRLLGKPAVDMDEDFQVARLLMSSLTVAGTHKPAPGGEPVNWPLALTQLLASFELEARDYSVQILVNTFASFTARLAQLPLARMAPESADQAGDWLTKVIEREIEASSRSVRSSAGSPKPMPPRHLRGCGSRPGRKERITGGTFSPTNGCSTGRSAYSSTPASRPRPAHSTARRGGRRNEDGGTRRGIRPGRGRSA